MNRCPSCGYIVPGAWTQCRRCGAALADTPAPAPPVRAPSPATTASTLSALALAPPPPPSAPMPGNQFAPAASPHRGFGAPDDALLPGASHRDLGPDTMLPPPEPVIRVAAAPKSGANGRAIVIGAFFAVCAIGAAFSLIPHGHHHVAQQPTILAPQPPFAGIPTSLSAIVRIEAESSRHTALGDVISAAGSTGAPLTLTQLETAQPDYTWVLGSQPSTTNLIISITSEPGSDVIAVSGTNREICAFGRWSPAAGATYVTMDHLSTCDASAAPATGWSPLAGGSAQDLPDENGN